MKAIILAAGRGSRLGALTDAQPKCLTPIAGRPLLDWQLSALHAAGVDDVTVVRGYRAECLANATYATIDNPDWAGTNMVATLRCASSVLERQPCLVLYADIAYHPDHVHRLAAAKGDLVVAYDTDWLKLWRLRFADPLADAETFRQHEGRLIAIGERTASLADIGGQYMGMLKLTPRSWSWIERLLAELAAETIAKLDMTSLLRRLLAAGHEISCLPVSGRWCEVDSGEDLARYESMIARANAGTHWSHDWRWSNA